MTSTDKRVLLRDGIASLPEPIDIELILPQDMHGIAGRIKLRLPDIVSEAILAQTIPPRAK
ncbi:hypothetical protein [Martelella mediterranea]|uniref:Uncharacterized protein n=1 Tax=Martelella mediterranea DSM 17316 TaxID=1122214 RepID=A0A1U9Z3D7_9HYPH|nr:hypothetical protein [Martelella mediterranea]AQZ52213.1 hypothetical protein Mame_02890 [Martelella mediterranea DSM 17316]